MKVTLTQAKKRAASFVLAVLCVMLGSMLFEPARVAITSTLSAAAFMAVPVGFVFLLGFIASLRVVPDVQAEEAAATNIEKDSHHA